MNRRVTCQVPTDVMEPTILKGSIITADTSHYYNYPPERWDIVIFAAPEIERLYYDLGSKKLGTRVSGAIVDAAVDIFEKDKVLLRPHIFYVKRIVGLPGERLRLTNTNIICNGKELEIPRDLRNLYGTFSGREDYQFGGNDYLVPDDCVYVMSDNLAKGKDSREIGGVPIGTLIARVIR